MCLITIIVRELFQAYSKEDANLGQYLHDRKDETMENVFKKNGKYHWRIVMEEYIFVVSKPAFEYFCLFKTNSGSSNDIVSSFIEAMDNRNIDLS